ncbi:CocE/NonD family hydrolase [Acuticoccus sp. M5D2P5]|uniref:CocE/NonD family hydrolase n=1 Tax=Acuticoccus kalidii TaxID=2910977 RepID=UPI001F3EA214|nr:CocE/NonD family hydrolase [Acuticoccus kalidii]MCF3933390.1 CocE/NonD family hydrolase [Acuticoccus kalidii]
MSGAVRKRYGVAITMRDGVTLSADILLPTGDGPFPAVFTMTPYGTEKGDPALETPARRFNAAGLAYVAVDVRGRYDSGGEWYAHPAAEAADGSDVISFIAAEPWSDGRVATTGHSYSGWNQWLIAMERNPHHVAMASSGAPTSLFVDWPNLDGVLSLQPIATWALGMMYARGGDTDDAAPALTWKEALWHLPLSELDTLMAGRRVAFWQDWLAHDHLDDYWRPLHMAGRHQSITLPTFHATGWFDARLKNQVAAYRGVMAGTTRDDHLLVIGPWLHSPVGSAPRFEMRDFGPEGDVDMLGLRAAWLADIMAGEVPPERSGVYYFLQVANEWRHAARWPIPGTMFVTYCLDSGGAANTRHGDGRLQDAPGRGPADHFIYDPADPVPTNWSPTRAEGIIPSEPQDNHAVEERQDVLVYSSTPLADPVEITGPVEAEIYFSTDAPDTDITVKLLDVDEEGTAFQLSYGIARGRFHASYEAPETLEPGRIYRVRVELQPVGNLFRPGHTIRIEVSASNFPFYARNLNTGDNNGTTSAMRRAHIKIEHSHTHPSRIILPVVPNGASRRVTLSAEGGADPS